MLLLLSCDDNNNDIEAPPIVDCAGMEGDSAFMDSCGVCRGDGSSCQLNFMLTDINPVSLTIGQLVGPQIYRSKVSLYYFPSSET